MTPTQPEGHPEAGGRRRAAGDLVGGLLSAGLGAAVLAYIRGFPELPGGQPGPALFPGIIGALLVLFGLVLVVRASIALRAAGHGVPAADRTPPRLVPAAKAAAVLAAIGTYLLVADIVGFVGTMVVLLWTLMLVLGARALPALGAAVAATVVVFYLFRMVLLVPLPQGPLG